MRRATISVAPRYLYDVSVTLPTTFYLNDYVGLAPDHPCSYPRYMREAFFDRIDIQPSNTHLPKGDNPDPQSETARTRHRICYGAEGA